MRLAIAQPAVQRSSLADLDGRRRRRAELAEPQRPGECEARRHPPEQRDLGGIEPEERVEIALELKVACDVGTGQAELAWSRQDASEGLGALDPDRQASIEGPCLAGVVDDDASGSSPP